MTTEIETAKGIAKFESVDKSPAKSPKSALARCEAIRDRFEEVGTDRMPTPLFLSLLGTRFMEEPKLLQCDFATVVRSAMQCHAWGLDPTGKRNGAQLIAYGKECQLQLGYGALIDLVTREGQVEDIDAQVVYDHDVFEVEQGSEPKLIHKPDLKASRRGRSDGVAYYAVAKFRSGHRKWVVMTRQEVEETKIKFAKNTPAWRDSFDQMAIKTAIHRLCKTLPVNTMASQALSYVERSEFQMTPAIEETPSLTDDEKQRVRALQSGSDELLDSPMEGKG